MLRSRVSIPVFRLSTRRSRECPRRTVRGHRSFVEETQLIVLQEYLFRCKLSSETSIGFLSDVSLWHRNCEIGIQGQRLT